MVCWGPIYKNSTCGRMVPRYDQIFLTLGIYLIYWNNKFLFIIEGIMRGDLVISGASIFCRLSPCLVKRDSQNFYYKGE